MNCEPPLKLNANFEHVVAMYTGHGIVLGVKDDGTFGIDGSENSIEIPVEFINEVVNAGEILDFAFGTDCVFIRDSGEYGASGICVGFQV